MIKNTFIGHFKRNRLTDSQTHGRKVGVTQLHIAANNHETYILGDININLLHSGLTVPMGIKKYRDFCAIQGLTQIIKNATRITETTSNLLDHILTNSIDKISQSGIIDVGISDHQLIFCTRKITKAKTGEKKFIKIRSIKNLRRLNYL